MIHSLRRRLEFTWRYIRGRTPWDSGIVPPEIRAWIEHFTGTPTRALDLGCGTGTTSIYLAEHGWNVVGIDFAPNAIARAKRKAREAGMRDRIQFHSADVARIDFVPALPPCDLVIDVGCLHSLLPDQRTGYAHQLRRLTAPGATFLLYAFAPRLRSNGQRVGIDKAGLRDLLGDTFAITGVQMGTEVTHPVASGWYTLPRMPDAPSAAQS